MAAGEANDGSYPWTVPREDSSLCRVRVEEADGDPTDADYSDGKMRQKIIQAEFLREDMDFDLDLLGFDNDNPDQEIDLNEDNDPSDDHSTVWVLGDMRLDVGGDVGEEEVQVVIDSWELFTGLKAIRCE